MLFFFDLQRKKGNGGETGLSPTTIQILEKRSEIWSPPNSSFPQSFYPSQQDRGIEQLGFDPWKILNSNPVSTILPKQARDRMGTCAILILLFCSTRHHTFFWKNWPVEIFSAIKNLTPDSRVCSSTITNVAVRTGPVSGLPCPARVHPAWPWWLPFLESIEEKDCQQVLRPWVGEGSDIHEEN